MKGRPDLVRRDVPRRKLLRGGVRGGGGGFREAAGGSRARGGVEEGVGEGLYARAFRGAGRYRTRSVRVPFSFRKEGSSPFDVPRAP